MKTYETSGKVEERGQLHVDGVPFAPGTEVQITISPKRSSAADFTTAWRNLCDKLRARPDVKNLTDDDIRAEVDRHRVGQ
jgi:2-methylaconitate cis-trans-isomerase PrpF